MFKVRTQAVSISFLDSVLVGPHLCSEGHSSRGTNQIMIRGESWEGWRAGTYLTGWMVGETGSRGDTEDMRANFKNSRVGFSSCFETPGAAPRRANNRAVSRHFCLFLFFLSCLEGADAWCISLSGILEKSKVIIIKLRIKAAAVYSLSIEFRAMGTGCTL